MPEPGTAMQTYVQEKYYRQEKKIVMKMVPGKVDIPMHMEITP